MTHLTQAPHTNSSLKQFMDFFETSKARHAIAHQEYADLYQAYANVIDSSSLEQLRIEKQENKGSCSYSLISYFTSQTQKGLLEEDVKPLIEKLLSLGLPIDTPSACYAEEGVDKEPDTALIVATRLGCTSIAALLLAHGASPMIKDDHGEPLQRIPLHRLPLHLAAITDDTKMIDLLLKHQTLIDAVEEQGLSALHYALHQGQSQAALSLLKHGADPYLLTDDKQSSLHLSVIGENLDISRILVQDFSLPVNALDSGGSTPLHQSCFNKTPELAAFLMDHGADLSLRNQEGLQAFDLARSIAQAQGNTSTTLFFEALELALNERQSLADAIPQQPSLNSEALSSRPLNRL